MKKRLLLFVMMLLPMVAMADAVKINGIYYNLISQTKVAEVTSNPNNYQGSIVIPETVNYNNVTYSVTSIGESAFHYCPDLTSITIPNSVTSIGSYAFRYCFGLTSVTIPNSVTSIGFMAFDGNYGLTSITIPNSVTSIDSQAFRGCSGLTYIKVESGNTKYDSRGNCNAIIETTSNKLINGCKSTVIPNSVTSIGDYAFSDHTYLTSITIPNSVTSINTNAFHACSDLTSINIPNSVTSIGEAAFSNCSSLTSVTIDISSPLTISENTFSDRANATLYVPAGCKAAYEAADYWKEFKEIIELGGGDAEISSEDNYIKIHTNTTGGYAAIGWHLSDPDFLQFGSENIEEYITAHISKIIIDNHEYSFQGGSLNDYGYDLSVEHTIMVFFDTPLTDIGGLFINRYNIDVLDMSHFNASRLENMNDCLGGLVSLTTWVMPADLNITRCAKRIVTSLDTTTLLHVYCPANRLDDYKSFFINTDTRVYNCLEANDSYYPDDQNGEDFGTVAEIVDLGLSVKWASWNMGADKPEGLGNLYAWGELNPKTDYSTSTYKFYKGGYTKYGSVDNKYQLDSEDDVAQQTWGDKWRIPTIEELKELKEKCTFTKTELNGVPVTKVTGPNGNFIYFPYPGNFSESYLYYKNSIGSYWSRNLESDSYAKDLDFRSGMPSLNGETRYHGQSVRPVYVEKANDIRDSEGFKYINDFTYIKDLSDYTGSGVNCSFINCSQHENGNIIKANVFCVENFYGMSEGQSYATFPIFADKEATTRIGEFNFCWSFYCVAFYGDDGLSGPTFNGTDFFFVEAYNTMEIGEVKHFSLWDGTVYTITLLDKIVSNKNSEKKLVFSVDKPLYFGGNNNGSVGIERFSNRVQIKYLKDNIKDNIVFADANVKAICVDNWDTDGDGELSYDEAAAVTTLSGNFSENTSIKSFDELAHFTGLTSIEEGAFHGCNGLTSITIPESVKSIDNYAFYYCSGLTSVTIPDNVTSIGRSAFSNCSGLTSVTIGKSVTSMGYNVFNYCDITTVTSLIENPFTIYGKSSNYRTFTQITFNNATLYVPEGTIKKYKATDGWKDFVFIEESYTTPPAPETCEKPTISYQDGKLTFTCATEGATCHYSITDDDIKAGSGNEVQLGVTYNISVYATKDGYENSETATATLCWIEETQQQEGTTTDVTQIAARPVLVKTDNGFITVEGIDEGTQVSVYSTDGKLAGSAISRNGGATISTSIPSGSLAIVKVGEKSVKVIMR